MKFVTKSDALSFLKTLADNSVDSIVTDPPYGLSKEPDMAEVLRHWLNGDDYRQNGGGFMGKSWDSFVPNPAIWVECLRVLKPGGHLVAFAGSRTYDLMATAIRLGGFQIRDQLMWVYGSGFPKSLDVSKAIDKLDASEERLQRSYKFTTWFRPICEAQGVTAGVLDKMCKTNTMARHWLDVPPNGKQPSVPTREYWEQIKYLAPEIPQWVEELVEERTVESNNFKSREVIDRRIANDTKHARPAVSIAAQGKGGTQRREIEITKAHTPEAEKWQGWGTAIKPAHEPIVLARKPLSGTVANNVIAYGTGALNIDGCRAGDRFPANFIHDGLNEVWAKYFYCAKAGKADRDAGLQGFREATAGEVTGGRAEGSEGLNSPRAGAGRTSGSRNIHPTVKPTDLMRWLCRLVTPPGGVVLDPFTGSGSTGRGAVLEGFAFIGCDMDEEDEYIPIANARILDALLTASNNKG